LNDVVSLQEAGLRDGDELSAVCSRCISGYFGERRIGCITCGSHEVASVVFSNESAVVLPFMAKEKHLSYELGELRDSDHEVELQVVFSDSDGLSYQGTLVVSKYDGTKRRLVIPDLDVDVMDAVFLEEQRQQMQAIRLGVLYGSSLMEICEFSNTEPFRVMASSRNWFEEGVVHWVKESVHWWQCSRAPQSVEQVLLQYDEFRETSDAVGRLVKHELRKCRRMGQKDVQKNSEKKMDARLRKHRKRALHLTRASERRRSMHQDEL